MNKPLLQTYDKHKKVLEKVIRDFLGGKVVESEQKLE